MLDRFSVCTDSLVFAVFEMHLLRSLGVKFFFYFYAG